MVLLPDGGFLRTIWGPVDPSQSLFYRETVGKKLVKSLTPGLASSFYYLGTPIGAILYASDFEDRNFVDWKYLNSMGWKILEYGGNYGLGIQNPDPNAIPEIYLLPSDGWADYSVSTNVVFTSGQFEQIYLVMRTARRPSCSRYRIGGNRLGISIFHFYDTPDSCRPYSMRVDVVGSEIRYYINDELVLSAIDDKYGRGGLGFLAYQVRDAFFDNLEVVKLGK